MGVEHPRYPDHGYNRDRIVMVLHELRSRRKYAAERVLSKDRSEEEQFLSDTIRKRVGERIYSRLREMCYFEELNGPDQASRLNLASNRICPPVLPR